MFDMCQVCKAATCRMESVCFYRAYRGCEWLFVHFEACQLTRLIEDITWMRSVLTPSFKPWPGWKEESLAHKFNPQGFTTISGNDRTKMSSTKKWNKNIKQIQIFPTFFFSQIFSSTLVLIKITKCSNFWNFNISKNMFLTQSNFSGYFFFAVSNVQMFSVLFNFIFQKL